MERLTIKLTQLEKTLEESPSRWVGRTLTGGFLYARYRFGGFEAGFGLSRDDAIGNIVFRGIVKGDGGYSKMSTAQMLELIGAEVIK
jgi:hypothetical protein